MERLLGVRAEETPQACRSADQADQKEESMALLRDAQPAQALEVCRVADQVASRQVEASQRTCLPAARAEAYQLAGQAEVPLQQSQKAQLLAELAGRVGTSPVPLGAVAVVAGVHHRPVFPDAKGAQREAVVAHRVPRPLPTSLSTSLFWVQCPPMVGHLVGHLVAHLEEEVVSLLQLRLHRQLQLKWRQDL